MPRPGPRPYECVRRAWHSDRHQPIRGSIIQQIFRVVTEAHSPATRKNREWQEKLPRVVLKAEEIMYSKANSEAEYKDPETLWERLNDAIDTIIRRDGSTETGQFLQPCIEAALVLGCVPVRASRSQRNSNPRSYLNPRFQEPAPAILDKTDTHRPTCQPSTPSHNQLSIPMSTIANQGSSFSISSSQMAPNTGCIASHTDSHLQLNIPRPMPSIAVESNSSMNFGSVYPLYYGSHFQNVESQFGFRSPQNSNLSNIIIGTPVGWHGAQPGHFANTKNLLPAVSAETASDNCERLKPVDRHGKAAELDCDLSLRLGPSDPGISVGKGVARLTDGGSSSYQKTSECFESCTKNLEFCFFPRCNANDTPESCLEKEGEVLGKSANLRKRKAPDHHGLEGGCVQWLQECQPYLLDGQIRWPDL